MANDLRNTQQAGIGPVPSHWKVAPLSTFVLRVTYGFTTPMPAADDGPWMVTARDVHSGRIDYSTARHTSWEAYRRELTDKSRPRINDVLLTKDGSIGRVAVCDRADVCINQSVALIQPSENIDSQFLKYLLQASYYQHRMEGDSDGTTIKHIYITRVDKMQVAVPPLHEQRAIAYTLGTLDAKIELNRQMNETLESIARALFKSWFVDFDPVRAKSEGRDAGLPKHLLDLFPHEFEQSEVGEIPTHWEVAGLDQIGRFLNGLALQKYPATGDFALPVVKIVQLRAGNTIGADKAATDLPPDYIVNDGDVLFSWSGSLECVLWTGGTGALNQHLFKVTSSNYQKWFYYLWIHQHLDEFRRIAASKATTMGHIQGHHLSAAKLALPPPELIRKAGMHIGPLVDAIVSNALQSRAMWYIRDVLLPKLISGKIPIEDIGRFIGGIE